MSKKKKKVRRDKHVSEPKPQAGTQTHYVSASRKQQRDIIPSWMIPAMLLITLIVFIPVMNADFVSLDDDEYVRNNYLLRSFSDLYFLLTKPVQGNYHPLTMFSLALNYHISGLNAWSYHVFNIILHLLNCFLVFRLVYLLSDKKPLVAFVAGVLFGIHPMHVESVAWVSERKDVLYGLFFLAGLISYVKFIDTGSRRQYLLSILFLFLSLLSKPAAVIFPVVLFSIDFFRKYKLLLKMLLEKIPFFILAMIGGILTIIGQTEVGATGSANFPLISKILFGFYGIMMYIVKLVSPVNLAVFYRYPAANESFSIEYYIAPIFFIILAFIFFRAMKNHRFISFGLLFYLLNLLLVLQFLPVGSAVISERYTYIPYIGLFFIIGWLINQSSKGLTIFTPIASVLAFLTWKQATTWQNSEKLWSNAIKNQPSYKAYANMAQVYKQQKNYDKAIEYYTEAIRLNIMDHESYANRANVFFYLNKPDQAFMDYKKALSLQPDYYPALDNMGAEFAVQGQYDSALYYANKAIEIKPDYKPAYSNRALTLMKLNRFEDAIRDWEQYLRYEPGDADIYNMIGSCYQALGKYSESLEQINKAIQMNPVGEFYLNRAYTYLRMNNTDAARKDALSAKQAGIPIPADLASPLGIQ